jgi:glycine/D-amino acid oxidase-like deaminating enzyme
MPALMNRSIDILDELARESGNVFRMNRRGYLFVTADPDHVSTFVQTAKEREAIGVGPLRVHATPASDYQPAPAEGFEQQPTGVDVITDPTLIRKHFPALADDTVAVLHARRCGWFSGQQLGMYQLERARASGVELVEGQVTAVDTTGGRVRSVAVSARDGERTISTPRFVNAAGPFVGPVARLLGIELPVFSERHAKMAFNDVLGAVPRHAPMMLWGDPVTLPWSAEERLELSRSDTHRRLLEPFPSGVHVRPEGPADSPVVLLIWTYDVEPVEPTFPITFDPTYPEVCLRGITRMIPAMRAYLSRLPKSVVDGGYYTKTRENRFLAGPLPVEGAYVLGALSGYGLMASSGAADLLADYISERSLPRYAPAFRLDRYDDAAYRDLLERWGDSGQL